MISEHTHIVLVSTCFFFFFFSSRRRHTRCSRDWSSDVCSSDLAWRWRWISAPCGDRTQCLERLVSRGKPRVGGCLERSEEHTSELQSRLHLVCRLLLEKKKTPRAREAELGGAAARLYTAGAQPD